MARHSTLIAAWILMVMSYVLLWLCLTIIITTIYPPAGIAMLCLFIAIISVLWLVAPFIRPPIHG